MATPRTAHVHGFVWLKQAPDIAKLQWNNLASVQNALNYIDKYVYAWNPHHHPISNDRVQQSTFDNPCLMDTRMIMLSNPSNDYNELLNCVQRHTRTLNTCLRKKGATLECRYKAPWPIQDTSTLSIESGLPKHTPARNDDRLNLHNPTILSIW